MRLDIRSQIKDTVIYQNNPKYIYIQQVESLIQGAKNSLREKHAISKELYERMHVLFIYI